MSEWRPIETAPKDGTLILLYVSGQFLGFGRSVNYVVGWMRAGDWVCDPRDDTFGDPDTVHPTPTHWMPLPEPPQ